MRRGKVPWAHVNLIAAVLWAIQLPIVVYLYWFHRSVWTEMAILYLALVSIYANFATHIAGWRADKPNA